MNELKHYGTPRHSGRYPWGSGENPYQSNKNFLAYAAKLRSEGLSEKEISQGLGMSINEFRNRRTLAIAENRRDDVAQAWKLKEKGYSNVAIGKKMGINESSVRSLLDPRIQERSNITLATSEVLKKSIQDKKYIDVGVGIEKHLGISRSKLNSSVQDLVDEGYTVHYLKVKQAGTGEETWMKVLAAPNTEWTEVNKNKFDISMPVEWVSEDGGRSYLGLKPIESIKSSEIQIAYAEDGGDTKDGLIEIRRGVDNLDLGYSKYAQVRIGVDDKMFLKGMAVYSDDMPEGKNVIFNTNKPKGTPINEVFKEMKTLPNGEIDQDNPFGSYIKEGAKGQRGALNIVNEEGDWSNWARKLSSQFLSKQERPLVQKQLDLSLNLKKDELSEILELTNPAVQKRLLVAFADGADAAAEHLKAAGLPRQNTSVLLPFDQLSDDEIYAPEFRNGEKVALVRHPHGGVFEIPVLTVNNKKPDIREIIGTPRDAVGINSKVAHQLSGADFDGDTVLVIPTDGKTIKSAPPLNSLKNFDPVTNYPGYKGMKLMGDAEQQIEMGKVSNLITDMTIKGATESEIVRAVKHSMVVIDAKKHKLDFKKSYEDQGIALLKTKYQGGPQSGASTLISRASSRKVVPHRTEGVRLIDPDTGEPGPKVYVSPSTGEKLYTNTGESYINKAGKEVKRTTSITKMAGTKDAHTLSSGTLVERIYADYANEMKTLANEARRIDVSTQGQKYSPSAKKVYQKEVDSLTSKLNIAQMNAPVERKAQLLANKIIAIKKQDNPDATKDTLKKIRGQALNEARARTGADKVQIEITDKEWEAIQAGAISNNRLTQILNNTNLETIKELATPREVKGLSSSKVALAKSLLSSGYTQAEVAERIGVSTSTLYKELNP